MADHKDPMSSDDLLRQAWVDLNREPDTLLSVGAAPVEPGDVDIPDMDDVTDRTASSSPVDSFVRTNRPAPPPPSTRRPPPPAPPGRSEPPPPTVPDKKSSKSRGRWVLAGIAVFALLRIFGSIDSSDDALTEDTSGAAASSIAPAEDTSGAVASSTAPTEDTSGAAASSIEPILDFDGFDSLSNINFVGTAKLADSSVSLTRREPGNSAGAVWSAIPVEVADGFESVFVFEIDHVSWSSIGDGFAFVIQNAGRDVVGDIASGNGFKEIPNSLAVEFDTVYHDYESDPITAMPDAGSPQLLANHVAIHTMGSEPNTSHARSKVAHAALDPVRLYDRSPHIALIRYVPGTLSVFVDDLQEPVLVAAVDLDGLLDLSGGNAYVGFTASTETFYADHLIHAWAYGSPCLSEGCQER